MFRPKRKTNYLLYYRKMQQNNLYPVNPYFSLPYVPAHDEKQKKNQYFPNYNGESQHVEKVNECYIK